MSSKLKNKYDTRPKVEERIIKREKNAVTSCLSLSAPLRPTSIITSTITHYAIRYRDIELPALVSSIEGIPLDLHEDVLLSKANSWDVQCLKERSTTPVVIQTRPNQPALAVDGASCQDWCTCDESGNLRCISPRNCEKSADLMHACKENTLLRCQCLSKPTAESDGSTKDEITNIRFKVDNFQKVSNPRKANLEASNLLDAMAESSSYFCSGEDLDKKDIAGVCMDGNFLWYSGNDCNKKCKCDGAGKVSCNIPSDCGPQKDVVQYCSSGPTFKCSCLIESVDTTSFEQDAKPVGNLSGAALKNPDGETALQENHDGAVESQRLVSRDILQIPKHHISNNYVAVHTLWSPFEDTPTTMSTYTTSRIGSQTLHIREDGGLASDSEHN